MEISRSADAAGPNGAIYKDISASIAFVTIAAIPVTLLRFLHSCAGSFGFYFREIEAVVSWPSRRKYFSKRILITRRLI